MTEISLCMIVKNEEHTLGRCLQSVAGVFDEIVIADTGSTDATVAVAERFDARVIHVPWAEDFAAARNAVFEHGTRDHLMWLDADDVLAQSERAKLQALKAALDGTVDAVSMLYDTAFDAAGNSIARNRRLRIVRRSLGFRWVGAVHEDLVADGRFSVMDSDIVVTHLKPDAAGPSDRNLRILERLMSTGKDVRPVDILNFARELEMHKEFARAIPYYEQFLATGEGDVDARLFALHKLASCYYMAGMPEKEWECTLRSFELDVPRPEFSCRMGERFIAAGRYAQAAFWYRLALQHDVTPNAWSIDNVIFRTWLPHKQLGLCYYQLGEYHASLHHNREVQRYLPDDPEAKTNIAVLESLIAQGERSGP